ncbi:RNA polymerase sigma factor [Paenibacillus sp. N1-5-1-14]|uniref:RNA polymerase sigma factor n=1 Tax=Paenibacillus radicibacter TaxID=2972488 RepID=UPI0021590B27|nr:RNA polymerase sigma factor [Paenibacillus radicibacter]MCR8645998.1 RNA polymerase sigma factor [Paenibacillus radicibacter]
MSESYDPIVEETRALHKKFEDLIEPHRQSLWRYCRYLTGSPWDGEDLFQETLLKSFATMAQIWHPLALKSYLFRIATNARIDGLRKKKVPMDTYAELDLYNFPEETVDPLEMIEALEVLVQYLPQRQIAVFLLMEVYGFTASDVAGMVRMTEGSVYAALHRARANIRKHRNKIPDQIQPDNIESNAQLLDTLLQAMRSGDMDSILGMFEESIQNDAKPGFQEYSKKEMLNGSFKHRGPVLHVSLELLWGRKVFVVLAETELGLALHDIGEYDFENNRIVYHRGYYFCKELLLEAGKTLNVPVQLQKAPNLDWREKR